MLSWNVVERHRGRGKERVGERCVMSVFLRRCLRGLAPTGMGLTEAGQARYCSGKERAKTQANREQSRPPGRSKRNGRWKRQGQSGNRRQDRQERLQ